MELDLFIFFYLRICIVLNIFNIINVLFFCDCLNKKNTHDLRVFYFMYFSLIYFHTNFSKLNITFLCITSIFLRTPYSFCNSTLHEKYDNYLILDSRIWTKIRSKSTKMNDVLFCIQWNLAKLQEYVTKDSLVWIKSTGFTHQINLFGDVYKTHNLL